jgi:hypothetical protein
MAELRSIRGIQFPKQLTPKKKVRATVKQLMLMLPVSKRK